MLNVILNRYYQDNKITLGILNINNIQHVPIFTLEKPNLDNQRNISCIPKGNYICKPYSSSKYKNVYQICDVPNRTKILFHVGNYPKDTRGCILPGLAVIPQKKMVSYSRNAMSVIRSLLRHNKFNLEIYNSM